MTTLDRDILFANEAFVVSMLQAVSGGALVAALSQSEVLITLAGRTSFLVFLTAMALALVFAVLSAYWKHQYKLWDVKAQVSASQNDLVKADIRAKKSSCYLKSMRAAFLLSLPSILVGIGDFVIASWLHG